MSFSQGFDAERGRFDPADDLRFRYPWDAAADAPSSSSSSSSSSSLGAEEEEARRAAIAVLRSVEAIGAELQAVLASHGIDLAVLDAPSADADANADANGPAAAAAARQRAWLGVVRDVMGDVVELVERCRRCTDGLDMSPAPPPMPPHPPTGRGEGGLPFEDSILRPPTPTPTPTPAPLPPRFVEWRQSARLRLLADQFDASADGPHPHLTTAVAAVRERRRDLARPAATAVELLLSAYRALDQMLQLRFQAHGIGFFDTLAHHAAAAGRGADTDDAGTWPQLAPAVPFHAGQVLRHARFGYRCAVTGWDQRPLQDVSRWEGVVGTARGRDQVRPWPAWKCPVVSHPGTPTHSPHHQVRPWPAWKQRPSPPLRALTPRSPPPHTHTHTHTHT